MQVTNRSDRAVTLDAVPVVEYTHFDALKQLTNADWVPQTMQSESIFESGRRMVLKQYPFMHRANKINYFTSNAPVDSYDTDRRAFLPTWYNV